MLSGESDMGEHSAFRSDNRHWLSGVSRLALMSAAGLYLINASPALAQETVTSPPSGQEAAGLQTAIGNITAAVTVSKAQSADFGMDAVTDAVNGTVTPVSLPTHIGDLLNTNTAFTTTVDGVTRSSPDAPNVSYGPMQAGRLEVINGGQVTTTGDDASGFVMTGDGNASEVVIQTNSRITTSGDNSPAVDAGGRAGANATLIESGGAIRTTGDHSAALIGGTADNSVFLLETRDRPAIGSVIGTTGHFSPAVQFSAAAPTFSTATVNIQNAPNLGGAYGFSTAGNESPLFDILMGDQSSFSFIAENASFGTGGFCSPVFNFRQDDT